MLLNVVSSQKRASWWSQSSFIIELEKTRLLKPNKSQKKSHQNLRKTHIFPGSEANRDCIKGYSRIMIDTDSKLKFLWDIIIALSAIGLGFIIPFSISFFFRHKQTYLDLFFLHILY